MSDGWIIGIVDNHQLLGRKVPEECHLSDPGCSRDIRDRRFLVTPIGEQPQSLPLETRPCSCRLTHSRMLASNILLGKDSVGHAAPPSHDDQAIQTVAQARAATHGVF